MRRTLHTLVGPCTLTRRVRLGRRTFTIPTKGPFSLQEVATFGFGQREEPSWDGVMRMAFCVDGYREQVGVEARQHGGGVRCTVHGSAALGPTKRQVARVLSLDHDGEEFLEVGRRDPVAAR